MTLRPPLPPQLPVYRHPSTVVIVDDSPSFLASLRFQLDERMPGKTFADACGAIAWLRARARGAEPGRFLSPTIDTFSAQPLNVALHVERICAIAARPQRFAEPSVLVADYAMPGMNGVQLCQAVRDLPCKTILLTGTADERIAIDAFNRGLIDRYIRKSDHDALERLDADLATLQHAWFLEQAAPLRSLLPLHGYGFIDDPAIAALAAREAADRHCVEHYLFHDPAGLLMADRDGRRWLLVIETEQTMRAHLEMARDDGAPSALLAALEARVVIPNFTDGDGMYSARFGKDWYRHTAPARVCEGHQRYYWAVFDLRPDFPPGRVTPFAGFLAGDGA
ncbi:hypothetical protein [uncultured Massilia sp.]|uniref:hypothetical protein n=1 Tax=uncultured Massilia sp. TaxID=169973 RepID=UPI0025E3B85C|nr:hypothetical protein [uncultured Massilia sp.]